MAPDAAECCAISRHCRAARRSPLWCAGGWHAASCGPGGTAQSAVPAQPTAHLSKRHNQVHLSWPKYWDRAQELTGPSIQSCQISGCAEMANEDHLKRFTGRASAWNAWRKKEPSVQPDLSGWELRAAPHLLWMDLSEANLSDVNLSWANLSKVNLQG